MRVIERTVAVIDGFQQRHPVVGFPYAVVKKFGEDHAGNLAAVIAYYGFFSLFPLLLVFVSILGLVLHGNPDLQQRIVGSALSNFPVIGPEISSNVHSITGSGTTLALGIVGTLWGGLGVTQAAQFAMNSVWNVPRTRWPNFLWSRLRGLGLLGILGTMTVVSSFLSGVAGSGSTWYLRLAGLTISLAVNLVLFAVSYRVLIAADLTWKDVLPGSATAAVGWTALQTLGGYIVTHQLQTASNVYGTFAIVIGLLLWIYLGAQLTLYCAEINVVRTRHLWPRSMQPGRTPTEADRTAAAAEGLGAR